MDNYNLIDKILHKIFIGNMFMKKTWVEIRNTNGNISKSNVGEFKKETYNGKYAFTSISLKNSTSVNIFKIKTKLRNIIETNKKDFMKLLIINLIWIFISYSLILGLVLS